MTYKDIIPLVEAYGFEFEFEKPNEKKMRFQGRGTFIDIWCSKRGTTLGIYNPKTKGFNFRKKLTLLDLENVLIMLKKAEEQMI